MIEHNKAEYKDGFWDVLGVEFDRSRELLKKCEELVSLPSMINETSVIKEVDKMSATSIEKMGVVLKAVQFFEKCGWV